MAPRFQHHRFIALPLTGLCAAAMLIVAPVSVQAHQLSNANGSVVPHRHVFKRNAYGDGFIVGHVAPTRHGHNMIIWSPAPSNAFGTPVPQMQITKPVRQRQLHQQRAPRTTDQIRNLRDLDPRRDRR